MKTMWMILVAVLITGSCFAQTSKVPAAAQTDFSKRFPNMTAAKWEVGSNGCEAEWKENGKEIAVVYNAKGEYLMTEREIAPSALPAAVTKGIRKAWPTAVVQEAETQTHADNRITYEVELAHDGVGREVTLDAKGTVLSDGADGSDDEGDDEEDDD
jgi:hypothetical protein